MADERPTSLAEAYARAAQAGQGDQAVRNQGTPTRVAELDGLVELARTDSAVFAALPEETRQRASDRALNLAYRRKAAGQ